MLYIIKGIKQRDLKNNSGEVGKSYGEKYFNYLRIPTLAVWVACVCLWETVFLSPLEH